jgi:hypothetical protein
MVAGRGIKIHSSSLSDALILSFFPTPGGEGASIRINREIVCPSSGVPETHILCADSRGPWLCYRVSEKHFRVGRQSFADKRRERIADLRKHYLESYSVDAESRILDPAQPEGLESQMIEGFIHKSEPSTIHWYPVTSQHSGCNASCPYLACKWPLYTDMAFPGWCTAITPGIEDRFNVHNRAKCLTGGVRRC